jgi:hypothetical protein
MFSDKVASFAIGENAHFGEAEHAVDKDRLAKKLYAEQFKAGAVRCTACRTVGMPYYYFINIRHPVIERLWKAYKAEHGILGAASDVERLRFEVGLLSEEACEKLWEAVTDEKE